MPFTDGYFTSKTYAGFVFGKLKRGETWVTAASLYKKIRKYTLISAVVRTLAIVISLLEKSALLLLFATSLLLLLPAIIGIFLIYASVCTVKYFLRHRSVREWLGSAEKITVYLSSERIFVRNPPLFVRIARTEASEYTHPVIILCSDPFASVKWYGINLLAVKPDYYFLIKKMFLAKSKAKITYTVLS